MFKKFTREDDVSSIKLLKTSQARAVRKLIQDQYPMLGAALDDIMPKKSDIYEASTRDKATIFVVDKKALFFRSRGDAPLLPIMHLVHKYPTMMTRVQADKGAIPFLMSGANCMCPGLTSPGGALPDGLAEGTPVEIMIEGKEHALGIGLLKMSSDNIKKVNKGIAIDLLHYIGDGLFKLSNDLK